MTFSEYCAHVRKHGYFSVELGDNRSQLGITDDACGVALEKWLLPLLTVCETAYVYRKVFKDRPYDVTPPPPGPKPVVLSETAARVEVGAKAMIAGTFRAYWAWALRHANLTVIISKNRFPTESLAKECWDPTVLTNLGAVAPRGSIELARREVAKQNVCCLFSRDSYNIDCHIFAPQTELPSFYKCFVVNCRFILKGLEQDLMPVRRKRNQ